MAKALWEVNNGDSSFVSCVYCAYKFLLEMYQKSFILDKPIRDKNYRDVANDVSAAEDFFGEHDKATCLGYKIEIGS
jgi:hypothetical protein